MVDDILLHASRSKWGRSNCIFVCLPVVWTATYKWNLFAPRSATSTCRVCPLSGSPVRDLARLEVASSSCQPGWRVCGCQPQPQPPASSLGLSPASADGLLGPWPSLPPGCTSARQPLPQPKRGGRKPRTGAKVLAEDKRDEHRFCVEPAVCTRFYRCCRVEFCLGCRREE